MACPGHAVLGRVIPKTLRTTNLQSITTKCKQRLSLGRSLGRPCPRRHALGMLSLAGSVPAPCERRTYTRKHNPNIFMQWGWELSQQWSSGKFRQIMVCNQKGQKGSTGRLGWLFLIAKDWVHCLLFMHRVEAYFYGWCDPNLDSEFEVSRWHNSRVWVWYFQVCKFQMCLLAKYLISANNCSCSHINFGPTVEEKLRNWSFAVSQALHGWFQLTSSLKINPSISTVYALEAYFYGWYNAIPISVNRWHNSRVCVLYFQVCKFHFCLLAKYFISVTSGSCSHINFVETVEEKLRNPSFAVSQILHLSGAKALVLTSIVGFPAPGLRKLSWHTLEVLVHEGTVQDKTCGIMMAILRGQDGPDIPMMGCIPTNDSTVFTCAGHMRWFFDCLPEVFQREPNLQEHPKCEKIVLFNDGCIFYCLDMWIVDKYR